jgi:hypothetical protein
MANKENPKKTAIISDGRKKIHSVFEDGKQMVEVLNFEQQIFFDYAGRNSIYLQTSS